MATAPATAATAALRWTRELAVTRMTEPPELRPRRITLNHPHAQHQPPTEHQPHLALQQQAPGPAQTGPRPRQNATTPRPRPGRRNERLRTARRSRWRKPDGGD